MAFNNSIVLAQNYLPLLDEVYKKGALTSVLDNTTGVSFINANTAKVYKTSMDGLGTYGRNTGYVDGAVTGSWETMTLAKDRGRKFMIDVMDDEETLNMAYGKLASEFIRTKVAPEIDAYTFAKLAGTANILSANADITVGTTDCADLIDVAEEAQSNAEVPSEGKILFVSETFYRGLKNNITREWVNENGIEREILTFDGKRVIRVPKARFNTAITLNDGSTDGQTGGGYSAPANTSYPINFMLVDPDAVIKVAKHVAPKVVTPEANQTADAWMFGYRIYHDVFVLDNKKAGIYMHRASTANAQAISG